MRRGWQLASLAFLALFVFAIWKSTSLALKDALGPGPGFFPLWLGVVGATLSLLLLLEVSRSRDMGATVAELIPDRDATFRILAVLLLLAIAAFTFERLGFRFTVLGFALLLLPALGARSIPATLIFALTTSIGVFHVFYYWLKVPLPIGPYDYVFKLIGL